MMKLDASNVAIDATTENGYLIVRVLASGSLRHQVDRPDIYGISVGKVDSKKVQTRAHRLVGAIRAGRVFENVSIQRDVNGKRYVASTAKVMGRHLDADLKKLGF